MKRQRRQNPSRERRAVHPEHRLQEAIESINSELEIGPLLSGILRSACALLGAKAGGIGLYDAAGEVFVPAAVFGMPEEVLQAAPLRAGEGLAGQVLLTQRPVVVERYADLPGGLRVGTEDYAAVAVPISWRGRLVGCFSVAAPPPRRFDPSDVDTLVLIARHAAVAIENAQRYEREQRRTERLRLITRVGRIITARLSLDELLQRAATAIHEVLGYPYISLARISSEEPGTLLMRDIAGPLGHSAPEHRFPISQGIVGAAARERRTQLVNDVALDPRYVRWTEAEAAPLQPEIRAELALPILLGDDLLGVLNVESPVAFDEEDVQSLQIVADHLAVAIRNARLFEAQERRASRMGLIVKVGQIITEGLALEEMLQRSADAIHEILGYASVDIPLVDPGDRSLLLVRARGGLYKKVLSGEDRLPIVRGIMGAAVRERRAQLVNDVPADPRYVAPISGYLPRAELAVPIHWRDEVLGVLNVEGDKPFDDDDLASLRIVADHLAVAIRNARLFESAQGQAVIEERQRLARDLHDSVVQLLFSVSLIAQSLGTAWRRDPAEGEAQVDRVVDLTRSALAEMRSLLAQLRPGENVLELPRAEQALLGISRVRRLGLVQALDGYARDVAPVGLEIVVEGGCYRAQPFEREEVLYRIGQEAIANAVRHAAAKKIDVRLEAADDGGIRLRVADDGRGFDASAGLGDAPRGLGIPSMQERAAALRGSLLLRSRAGCGTEVEVRLPPSPPVA